MLPVRTIIQGIASILNREVLKKSGFKKVGMTWLKEAPWTQVINMQMGKWNTQEEGTFTINLGLHIPELHAAIEAYPVSGSVKEYDCDVRQRIGLLMPVRQDFWWEVKSTSDVRSIADEVSQALLKHGIPWLDQTAQSLSTIAEELKSHASHSAAAVAFAFAGDLASANKSMANAFAHSNPLAFPKLQRLAKAHGITIPN